MFDLKYSIRSTVQQKNIVVEVGKCWPEKPTQPVSPVISGAISHTLMQSTLLKNNCLLFYRIIDTHTLQEIQDIMWKRSILLSTSSQLWHVNRSCKQWPASLYYTARLQGNILQYLQTMSDKLGYQNNYWPVKDIMITIASWFFLSFVNHPFH